MYVEVYLALPNPLLVRGIRGNHRFTVSDVRKRLYETNGDFLCIRSYTAVGVCKDY